jgi:K+-sensing histidine kinase KdpD
MKSLGSLRANVNTAIGVLVCGWSAVALSVVFSRTGHRTLLPILFLAVIILVAMRCGVTAGILGSILAAIIFAYFVYRPIGSVFVENKSARMNLAWLLLGGLAFSYLLGPGGRKRPM